MIKRFFKNKIFIATICLPVVIFLIIPLLMGKEAYKGVYHSPFSSSSIHFNAIYALIYEYMSLEPEITVKPFENEEELLIYKYQEYFNIGTITLDDALNSNDLSLIPNNTVGTYQTYSILNSDESVGSRCTLIFQGEKHISTSIDCYFHGNPELGQRSITSLDNEVLHAVYIPFYEYFEAISAELIVIGKKHLSYEDDFPPIITITYQQDVYTFQKVTDDITYTLEITIGIRPRNASFKILAERNSPS